MSYCGFGQNQNQSLSTRTPLTPPPRSPLVSPTESGLRAESRQAGFKTGAKIAVGLLMLLCIWFAEATIAWWLLCLLIGVFCVIY